MSSCAGFGAAVAAGTDSGGFSATTNEAKRSSTEATAGAEGVLTPPPPMRSNRSIDGGGADTGARLDSRFTGARRYWPVVRHARLRFIDARPPLLEALSRRIRRWSHGRRFWLCGWHGWWALVRRVFGKSRGIVVLASLVLVANETLAGGTVGVIGGFNARTGQARFENGVHLGVATILHAKHFFFLP